MRLLARAGLCALLALLACAPGAAAQSGPDLREVALSAAKPRGYALDAARVRAISARSDEVTGARRDHPGLRATVYTRGPGTWQVSWFEHDGGRRGDEVAQVRVDDRTGAILEAWTGDQVAWTMARGYAGAFGRKFNSPWLLIPLGLLFLAPFVDPRRPFRIVHLDLLVLLAFGVSHVFFNRAEIGVSAPLVYPVLGYLLARLTWIGARPRRRPQRLLPVVPMAWLVVALAFLVSFRVALNLIDSNVIDVGYASVVGADRIADGDQLYGPGFSDDLERGDTYGPLTYLAYVPFEQVFKWGGGWDGLPAAHAAAIAFDLLTLAGLILLGMRMRAGPRGRELGVALGYAWATYPYALFVLASNANDSLVALTVVAAMLALTLRPARRAGSALARGAGAALAGAAKLAPIVLAPLILVGTREEAGPGRRRELLIAGVALALVLVALFAPFIPDGGLREIYDRTLGYQAARPAPFSIWGQVDLPGWVLTAARAAACVFAVVLAIRPRRRDAFQVAALAGAAIIALQLTATYWFYLYVVWFAPLALVALLGPLQGPAAQDRHDAAAERGDRSAPAVVA